MEPFLRREGFRYSKEAEEQKAKALATVLSCGVDGEEFLVDFLVKDVTLIDNRFLLKSYGEFAHGEWLKKTTIVRALGEAKGSYVPEKLATYLMCVGAENQFAVFFQPALVETLGRLKAYEALEKYVDSGQRVPAVQLALDILRLRDAGTADHPMNAWDDGGYTPLQRAVAEKDRAAAQRVLDAGADIDVVRPRGDDSVGQTALHMAVLEKDAEMVGLLLSRGADPDIQDMGGSSALQRAGAMGLSRIAALLVEGGADVNIKTLSGKTPLAWARQNGHKDVAAYLAEHGGT